MTARALVESTWVDGLLLPTRRRVYPRRRNNRPRARPTLVRIDLTSPRRSG